MSGRIEQRIARLEAREAIRRVLALYGDAVRRKDADAIAELFTPDARVVIAGGKERVGRAEIVEGLRATASGYEFLSQQMDVGLIDLDGDSARARVGVIEANQPLGKSRLNLIFGIYEDEYRVSGGLWRFHRRNFTLQQVAGVEGAEMAKFAPFAAAFPIAAEYFQGA